MSWNAEHASRVAASGSVSLIAPEYMICNMIRCLLLASLWCLPNVVLAQPQPSNPLVPRTDLGAALALEKALVATIEKAERSVVAIARGRRGHERQLSDPQFIPHEYSAGVVVDRKGLILTNYHTLGDVKENIFVVWSQKKPFVAKVKSADPWTDLAILEIKSNDLTPITFGDGAQLKKGRIVIALGNPHAIARDGNVSATWGIVSNIHRKIDGPLQGVVGPDIVRRRETLYHFGGLLQTDAKLAKSTSGGPLLDLDGKMVGLSTSIAVLAGFEKGTGYAIPVTKRFQAVVQKLKKGEEIESGFLGVAPRNPNSTADELGVVLNRVESGTPAALGGLMEMDEIVGIDGHDVRSVDDLFFWVGTQSAGHVAKIAVREPSSNFFGRKRRDTKQVRLSKKPNESSRPRVSTSGRTWWRGMRVDYGTALSLRQVSKLDPEGCVIVVDVQQDSAAWKAGLRVGSVISRLNGTAVTHPEEFNSAVEGIRGTARIGLFDAQTGHSMVTVATDSD